MALADAKGAFLINERSQQTYSRARYIHLRFAFVLRVPLNNLSIGSTLHPPAFFSSSPPTFSFLLLFSSLFFLFCLTRATMLIPRSDAHEIFRKSPGNGFVPVLFANFGSICLFERGHSLFGGKFSKEFLNKKSILC